MKLFLKSFYLSVILISICCIGVVLAEDESTDYNKKVQSIASFFNSRVKENVGEGEFEVKTISANEKSTRYNIKYKLPGGKAFQYEYDFRSDQAGRIIITLELSANKFSGINGLVFNYLICNPDIGCSKDTYIVIPKDKRFTSLDFDKKMLIEVRDLNQDNDSEIINFEQQPWSVEDCGWGDTNITGLFWPQVFRLDPKSGKLLDVSQRFPQVYKEELEKWHFSSEAQRLIKNSTQTSPECKAKYFGLLARLQKASGEAKAQAGENIDFSGTWSGYRIISGQKRFFNLVLKQNNSKIEGISTDTLAFSDGNKAVQGTVSGDISDMRIQFTRKWIDHPKGMTGETDFSGTMDRETGTVTGTYKINNDTGDWVMERKTIDAGLSQPKTSLSPNIPATEGNVYEGTWVGTYSCRQGITGLQLQLKAFSQEQLAGVFSFFPVSSNPNVPYGSFNVNAMVRRDGKLVVRAGNWIQRPRGFSAVNLEGQISSDSQSISGRVLTYGCSGFQVQRKND